MRYRLRLTHSLLIYSTRRVTTLRVPRPAREIYSTTAHGYFNVLVYQSRRERMSADEKQRNRRLMMAGTFQR
jgi:hypothetical protein